jgi:hypothetical protein
MTALLLADVLAVVRSKILDEPELMVLLLTHSLLNCRNLLF